MNGFRDRSNSWSGDPTPSEADREGPWKNLGTSMSAISFGFVATAILISMFLIMAIFEHLIRQRPSFLLSRGGEQVSSDPGRHRDQARLSGKLGGAQSAVTRSPFDVSVLMPGQKYPTYIAQPAPLPCAREGISWPSHDRDHNLPQP